VAEDSLPDESLFLISSDDVWYRDIIIYLQTQTFWPDLSSTDRRRIRYQARQYIILGDTLYRRGVDSIFRRCLTYDEAEKDLNECHSGACGVICLGMPLPKRSYEKDTSSLLCLKTVLMPSRNAMLVKCTITR
jgi:hypothetical protein